MNTGSINTSAPLAICAYGKQSNRGQMASQGPQVQKRDTLEISGGLHGLAGKLNSIEHSNSQSIRPNFLKGILEKLTGQKIGDLDIDAFQLTKSSSSIDAEQLTAQSGQGTSSLTYEHLRAQSQQVSLSLKGSIETKSGQDVDFVLQLDMRKLSMAYQGYSISSGGSQSNTGSNLSALA